MDLLSSHWTDFHETWYLPGFWNSVEKAYVSLKSNRNNGHFTSTPIYFFVISRSVLLRMRNVSDRGCTETQNTQFMFNKSFHLWKNVEKYCRAEQATDDSMAHAHGMLDKYGYRHTLRICDRYCLSSTTMVARTRLSVTFIRTLSVLSGHDAV
jgi:hypothetical protein